VPLQQLVQVDSNFDDVVGNFVDLFAGFEVHIGDKPKLCLQQITKYFLERG